VWWNSPTPVGGEQPWSAPPVILVAEDEPPTAELLRELLADEGYAVETADDGPTALARVQAGGIDRVLLDRDDCGPRLWSGTGGAPPPAGGARGRGVVWK
jgi:hypothetical protein